MPGFCSRQSSLQPTGQSRTFDVLQTKPCRLSANDDTVSLDIQSFVARTMMKTNQTTNCVAF